ncbi:HD-GYP domain-containing protein [Deinococcus sp. ME38]|uniref:HD-GYP domain-containing protein n=1 Tax=Deinococcus sp. ME38 TaxID=3400344 RepID=UPI003B5A854B
MTPRDPTPPTGTDAVTDAPVGTSAEVLQAGQDSPAPVTPEHDALYTAQLERYAAEFGTLYLKYRQQTAELETATRAVVHAFVVALGAHDPYTRRHTQRVQTSALTLAHTLGWDSTKLEDVRLGALLHDIGKTSVSDTILRKPGRLTDAEFQSITQHPVIGAHMIAGFPALTIARPFVLHHHERWDGRGYPDRLAGTDIPVQGRLLAVVDAVDAMLTDRPYRQALSVNQVTQELLRGRDHQFDPDMIEAFLDSGALDLYRPDTTDGSSHD